MCLGYFEIASLHLSICSVKNTYCKWGERRKGGNRCTVLRHGQNSVISRSAWLFYSQKALLIRYVCGLVFGIAFRYHSATSSIHTSCIVSQIRWQVFLIGTLETYSLLFQLNMTVFPFVPANFMASFLIVFANLDKYGIPYCSDNRDKFSLLSWYSSWQVFPIVPASHDKFSFLFLILLTSVPYCSS